MVDLFIIFEYNVSKIQERGIRYILNNQIVKNIFRKNCKI